MDVISSFHWCLFFYSKTTFKSNFKYTEWKIGDNRGVQERQKKFWVDVDDDSDVGEKVG